MRVAVLGTGRMGRLRAGLLARHPKVREVVVASASAERARSLATEVGGAPATVEEALSCGPDGIVIASSTADHAWQLEASLRVGAPVLCEKPIALDLESARRLADAADAAGVPVWVGFHRRFDPGYQALYRAVRSGRLGVLYHLRMASFDAAPSPEGFIPGSGGIFRDLHVHEFDVARWLTGREVATVYAVGALRLHDRYARYGDVDTATVVLTMDDGLLVTIDGARHDPRGQDVRCEALGSRDSLAVGLGARTPLCPLEPDGRDAPRTPGAGPYRDFVDRFATAFERETAAFADYLAGQHGAAPGPASRSPEGGAGLPCSPRDAVAALRIAVACDRSRAEGRPVDLKELSRP